MAVLTWQTCWWSDEGTEALGTIRKWPVPDRLHSHDQLCLLALCIVVHPSPLSDRKQTSSLAVYSREKSGRQSEQC